MIRTLTNFGAAGGGASPADGSVNYPYQATGADAAAVTSALAALSAADGTFAIGQITGGEPVTFERISGTFVPMAAITLGVARVWSPAGLFDIDANAAAGDYGVVRGEPCRLKSLSVGSFSGLVWVPASLYSSTLTLSAITDGTEDNTVLGAYGWTIVNDAGATVTATAGFQRLTSTTNGNAARLRTLVGVLSSTSKVLCMCEVRANSQASQNIWALSTFDGGFSDYAGQDGAANFGFTTGTGAPLQSPNPIVSALPGTGATADLLYYYSDARTVSTMRRNGSAAGDYSRSVATAVNLTQVYAANAGNTPILDWRGYVLVVT